MHICTGNNFFTFEISVTDSVSLTNQIKMINLIMAGKVSRFHVFFSRISQGVLAGAKAARKFSIRFQELTVYQYMVWSMLVSGFQL